jgi:fructosamine-3-kinase
VGRGKVTCRAAILSLQITNGAWTIGFMTPHEVDVSWDDLRPILREWAGADAELDEVSPLHGGQINTTLKLTAADGQKCVLKITPHRVDRSYRDEAHQLKLLAEAGIPVPTIYACKTASLEQPFSYLLMEFIEGVDLSTACSQCGSEAAEALQRHLAELVLQIHDCRAEQFQRVVADESKPFDNWPACYRDVYDSIWRDVQKSNLLPVKSRKLMNRVHDRLERLIAHDDCPRLTHWDLWATNILAQADADGVWRISALLDPNCKFGHAEAELAYLELFHTVTPAFMKVYQQNRRLGDDYHRVRKPVYQLYSLLNHVHLFGQDYLKAFSMTLDRVGQLV